MARAGVKKARQQSRPDPRSCRCDAISIKETSWEIPTRTWRWQPARCPGPDEELGMFQDTVRRFVERRAGAE
ncbi:hypothetical protein ACU4GD_34970 [Cupriavidus basilensis]